MKSTIKIFVILGVVTSLLTYSGCKKKHNDPEPVTDQQLTLLSKSVWKATSVVLNNTAPPSADYTNFTITLSGTKGQNTFNYTTGGRPATSPWPASGTFAFDATNPATTIKRNDDVVVTYAVTDDVLTMTFLYSGAGFPGRVGSVNGQWTFTFGH